MVRDATSSPAPLPLITSAAAQMWAHRDRSRRLMTRAAYTAIGGITGPLAARGERLLATFSEPQLEVTRALLQPFVAGERPSDSVSRQRLLSALPSDAPAVLERLIAVRLLVAGRGPQGDAEVAVTHRALLARGAPLRLWLDERPRQRALA